MLHMIKPTQSEKSKEMRKKKTPDAQNNDYILLVLNNFQAAHQL